LPATKLVTLVEFYANFPGWGTLKTKLVVIFEEEKKAGARLTAPKKMGAPSKMYVHKIILKRFENGRATLR
jgi:hypothetical protein